ncbi:MAG: phytoene dehydrogenase [Polyangiaceae bacterium]|nr:phytoene dehydrogenase [Polyangiaceae bacterium]
MSTGSSKHYDVVVLGAEIGALAAAALLARRSWRVLVLGHGYRKSTYAYDGITLSRRPFSFLSASSPVWGRVLVELAQSQTFRRRLISLDPMLQVLGDRLRLDLPPDTELFAREIDREFPAVRRVVDDLYTELARTNALADAAFERDAVWPPGGFWERRETTRILSTLPYLQGPQDFLAEFPREHAFRDIVATPARFACDLADGAPPFATARLHGAWTRGVSGLAGGEDELVEFLLERIRAHGGATRLDERASALVHKGGKVRGVHIDGDESPIGVSFVVSSMPTAPLLDLARFVPSRTRGAQIEAVERRFVMSIVVRPEGVPSPLAIESFLLPETGPVVHLQKAPGPTPGTVLLVAEALVRDGAPLDQMREAMLETVFEFLPFLERHVLMCDSPHDGRPLWDMRGANALMIGVGKPAWELRVREIDRALLRPTGGSLEIEPMIPRFRIAEGGLHGLAGEPLRTPLGNAFVTGRSTLPALGQEGELLAAWGVARIITRTDRRKEKMLREMWSKVELS